MSNNSSPAPLSPKTSSASVIGPRGKRVLHTGAWALIAKMCAAANLFLSVPFVLHAVGSEQFGAWATLVSLVTFAGFLDFGFGNGTMNLIAAAEGRGAREEVATILRESRRMLARLALVLAMVALAIVPLTPWERLLGMPATMAETCRMAAASVLFTIVLAVPLNLATRVQLGLGRGDRAFRWQALGQLLTLSVVIVLARAHASLAALTAAAVATPLLASAANSFTLWQERGVTMSKPPRHLDIAARIRNEGVLFFVLQMAAALAYSADLPLISALRGATDAGSYAIVQRLFSIIPMGLSLVWAPLWPIYRQALASGDHGWVTRTLRRSIVSAVAFAAVCAAILAVGFDHISALWVHSPLVVTGALLGGFVTWCVIDAAGTALATFLNAASVMRYQVIVASTFALACFAAKVWGIAEIGITSIPWITSIVYCLISLLPFAWFGRRIVGNVLANKY